MSIWNLNYSVMLFSLLMSSCAAKAPPGSKPQMMGTTPHVHNARPNEADNVVTFWSLEEMTHFLKSMKEGTPAHHPNHCSATFLESDLMLTAHHCIGLLKSGGRSKNGDKLLIFIGKNYQLEKLNVKDLKKVTIKSIYLPPGLANAAISKTLDENQPDPYANNPDVALLRFENPVDGVVLSKLSLPQDKVEEGRSVIITGFGLQKEEKETPEKVEHHSPSFPLRWSRVDVAVAEMVVPTMNRHQLATSRTNPEHYFMTVAGTLKNGRAVLMDGDSGAPVLDAKDPSVVLGVNSSVIREKTTKRGFLFRWQHPKIFGHTHTRLMDGDPRLAADLLDIAAGLEPSHGGLVAVP